MFIPYDILVKKKNCLDDWIGKRKNPRKMYRTHILGIAFLSIRTLIIHLLVIQYDNISFSVSVGLVIIWVFDIAIIFFFVSLSV